MTREIRLGIFSNSHPRFILNTQFVICIFSSVVSHPPSVYASDYASVSAFYPYPFSRAQCPSHYKAKSVMPIVIGIMLQEAMSKCFFCALCERYKICLHALRTKIKKLIRGGGGGGSAYLDVGYLRCKKIL